MFQNITPEQAGISSKRVLNFFKVLDNYGFNTHSVIMARGNNIFAEAYYKPFDKDFKHRLYSASKSFVGIAIG
ncbi:MAG: serine hydrolase, partial [Clostridia bacterium]|nr:serine hydrolase [Clostridia bacterium]